MKTIYILYEIIAYEPGNLIAAFSTRDKASNAKEKMKEKVEGISLEIIPMEVDPDQLSWNNGVDPDIEINL